MKGLSPEKRIVLDQMAFAGILLFFITGKLLFVIISAALLFGSLAGFLFMARIADGFQSFARFVGNMLVRIVLVLFFYIIFSPYAFVMRLFREKRKPFSNSSFIDTEKKYTEESFKKPW